MSADKKELKEIGLKIDELASKKKKYDDASDKLGKQINKLMLEYEKLTDRVYGKKPFKSNVQEI
jgi:DNA repair ATPase RecN